MEMFYQVRSFGEIADVLFYPLYYLHDKLLVASVFVMGVPPAPGFAYGFFNPCFSGIYKDRCR